MRTALARFAAAPQSNSPVRSSTSAINRRTLGDVPAHCPLAAAACRRRRGHMCTKNRLRWRFFVRGCASGGPPVQPAQARPSVDGSSVQPARRRDPSSVPPAHPTRRRDTRRYRFLRARPFPPLRSEAFSPRMRRASSRRSRRSAVSCLSTR